MMQLDRDDRLYVGASFVIQSTLVVFFALRLWNFPLAMKVGWIVYALAVPAVAENRQQETRTGSYFLISPD